MRPSLRARRHGCSRDVTHAASCVAGVLTPPAASASNSTPASSCSVMPARNSPTAVARASSATRSDPRRAFTSSGVLIRRAARIASSPSTSSALGKASGSSLANDGVRASVPTRRAVEAPSMPLSTSMSVIGFHASPYRRSCGMSSGMPSSHVLFRWISPVDRTTVQIGPNGLVPATQSCGAPEK